MSLDFTQHTEVTGGIFEVARKSKHEPLSDCVTQALDNYFARLDGHPPTDLYQLVLAEVERPLFAAVMAHLGGNQTRAATALGISRSTLRKKLAQYHLD